MDDHFIVTTFTVIDDLMTHFEHRTHRLAHVSDSEVLTVAVVAARTFRNNLQAALSAMRLARFIPAGLSISRFNRRLHALKDWLEFVLESLAGLCRAGAVYVIDSLPVPVCRRVRARRCRKVRGKAFCGYCAAKRQSFFGWRLHLVCDQAGMPVSFSLLEASAHDLTAMHELSFVLPPGSKLYGDKAFNAASDEASLLEASGVEVVPIRRKRMKQQNSLTEMFDLARYRRRIETVNSQLEAMGMQDLRARTNEGFFLKVHASLLALAVTNAL